MSDETNVFQWIASALSSFVAMMTVLYVRTVSGRIDTVKSDMKDDMNKLAEKHEAHSKEVHGDFVRRHELDSLKETVNSRFNHLDKQFDQLIESIDGLRSDIKGIDAKKKDKDKTGE